MDSFFALMLAAYKMLDTQYTLPWIGRTSILRMLLFIALLDILFGFVASLMGGKDSDE